MAIGLNLIKFKKKIRQIDEILCEFDQNHGNFVKLTKFLKVALVFLPREMALIFGN